MNRSIYKIEILKYEQPLGNITAFSVVFQHAVTEKLEADRFRESIEPTLKDNFKIEVTAIPV